MKTAALLALTLIATTGCVKSVPADGLAVPPAPEMRAEPQASTPGPDACGANAVRHFIGQPSNETNIGLIEQQSGAERVRVITPGMAVTMDYRETRLNISIDAKGMVDGLTCG